MRGPKGLMFCGNMFCRSGLGKICSFTAGLSVQCLGPREETWRGSLCWGMTRCSFLFDYLFVFCLICAFKFFRHSIKCQWYFIVTQITSERWLFLCHLQIIFKSVLDIMKGCKTKAKSDILWLNLLISRIIISRQLRPPFHPKCWHVLFLPGHRPLCPKESFSPFSLLPILKHAIYI